LQPVESFTELLRRMAFDKQQNGLLGPFSLSHSFVSFVNRQWISQTGNDWCEQLSVARESVHCILDEIGFDSDDQRSLSLPPL
jgi:hypothetical protein